MYDKALVLEILDQIRDAVETVLRRFKGIHSVDDFLRNDEGLEKLDAICMKLIAIGESLKNIDKISHKELLEKYSEVDWKKAMGLRDIITHHYFDLDADVVFNVCKEYLRPLGDAIKKIEKELCPFQAPD
jgi:uncharacterized protein with HEPN domain